VDAAGLLSLILLMLAVIGVFAHIPVVSDYAFWFVIVAYFIYDWGANWLGTLSLLLLGLAIVGVFINIPVVSNYAFWLAIAAYFIRDWTYALGPGRLLVWAGVVSLFLLGLAVVGVFILVPLVSNYAFSVAVTAYLIRVATRIPPQPTIAAAVQKHAVLHERRLPGEVRLNNLWQIRAPCAALVVQISRLFPRAIGRDLVGQSNSLASMP
jgi:hypothetical protein